MSRRNQAESGGSGPQTPQTPSMSKAPTMLLLAAIALFLLTRFYIAFILTPWITDVTLYFDYSVRAIDRHKTPYRDFAIEYPPVAWWSMCVPRLLDERRLTFDHYSPVNASITRDYHQAYRLEMALFDVVSFGLFVGIVCRRRPRSAGWAALTYVVTSTILCHVLYDHLDEGTLLFSMLGAYAWVKAQESRRWSVAWLAAGFFFFGVAFSYKIIPVIAVPFLLLAEWRSARAGKGDRHFFPERPSTSLRLVPGFAQKVPGPCSRWKRLAAGLAGLTLGMAGPFAIQYMASGPGVFALFAHHAGRGIQVESLYSTVMWLGSLCGWPISISLNKADGAFCVFGDWSDAMKLISTLLLCGFLGTAGIWAIVRRSRLGRAEALGLACYALGASAIFSKVLSPQYFVWSIPLLLLAGVELLPEKGKSTWILAGLLIVAAGLTTWLFPYHYFCAAMGPKGTPTPYGLIPRPDDLLAPSSLGYAVLALRNILYLGVVGWLGYMVPTRWTARREDSRVG
jgi:hypothetical protein